MTVASSRTKTISGDAKLDSNQTKTASADVIKTSDLGVAFIKRWEGCRLVAYQDVAGVWTIGYGHTAGFKDGRFGPNTQITAPFADELLREDLAPRENNLNIWAETNDVSLNQNEFDALISFIFNVGFGAFQSSTAAQRLITGDRIGAAEALTWWNKATVNGEKVEVLGLTRRRAAEKAMFLRCIFT